jgi:thiosulfate/3-mercaptopyruvate sulfurtransferase
LRLGHGYNVRLTLAKTMTSANLPLLLEPADVAARLGATDLRIVDLNPSHIYARAHVPGAVSLDYARIIVPRPPAAAMLPSAEQLADVMGSIGLTPDHHVIAYDDEGNGRAGRFLWTLHAIGHTRGSLLNGGLRGWLSDNRPTENAAPAIERTTYPVRIGGEVVADKDYILAHLKDPAVLLVDTRAPEEYAGTNKRAQRGGHIPGAVNFNWTDAMDQMRQLRFKDLKEIRKALEAKGITPEKEIITYCQTHHRSAHTYMVLKVLGYPKVKSYPGSWSEWGNLPDTPIE